MRKFLPYILILVMMVGLFSPTGKAQAQTTPQSGTCVLTDWDTSAVKGTQPNTTQAQCTALGVNGQTITDWTPNGGGTTTTTVSSTPTPTTPQTQNSAFQNKINSQVCWSWSDGISPGACMVQISYLIFYQLTSYLLYVCAYVFNVFISIGLSSTLFTSAFVASAWAVVRDISNLFFILILIYIAVKIILGIGGHDVKKMIVQVIIMALLINFSMFFTEVVIDTSNIFALIFYNKLAVQTNNSNGQPIPYASVNGEKDIAGGMVAAFDPTSRLSDTFFGEAKEVWINGVRHPEAEQSDIPASILIAIIVIAGLVMGFAAYALFVSGFSFLGRLIELWILIIFSPFAFMSSSIPELSHREYLGWDSWLKRLLATAFMAPVFMFFLYFIFLLIHSKIYEDIVHSGPLLTTDPAAVIKTLLGIILPTLMILILLLQATKFAKKGSGQAGDYLVGLGQKAAGFATGAALGVATGGTAMALRGTVGRGTANLAESNWVRDRAAQGKFGGTSLLKAGSYLGTKSFDVRNAPGAGNLAKSAGVNLNAIGKPKEGFAQNRAAAVKKKEEFASKLLDTSDYGKAELTRGGMSADKAADTVDQMVAGGMELTDLQKFQYRMNLSSSGLTPKEAANAARYMNTVRRSNYADRLEKRAAKWESMPGARLASKRIAANKIRKDAAQLKEEGSVAHALEHLSHAMHDHGPKHEEEKHAPAAAPHAPTSAPTHPPADSHGAAESHTVH